MNIINTDKLNDEKMTNDIIDLSNNKNDKKEDKNELYIKEILGYVSRGEMVHIDNLVHQAE